VALAFPLKQHRQDSLGSAEAVCEPKPSAWLDVERASEGHFPPTILVALAFFYPVLDQYQQTGAVQVAMIHECIHINHASTHRGSMYLL
jgi:hypothetical protein